MPDLSNKRAVVTGASSGIGAAMARQLAAWGCDLVVTARREDRLEALAEELRAAHDIEVDVVALDLAEDGAAGALMERAHAGDKRVDILINNAGLGVYRPLAELGERAAETMLRINVHVLTTLTRLFVERVRARDTRSYVLNVASVLGFGSCANYSIYAASKAYVRSFSESVAAELKKTKVSVTVLCPGGTATEFHDLAGQKKGSMFRMLTMSPRRCARIGLRAMLWRRRHIVPGFLNKSYGFLTRLVPRRLAAWFMGVLLGKPQTASSS